MADVTQVQVGDKYELKDSLARSNKIDKYEDNSVSAVVDFLNGVKIKGCKIYYDTDIDTVYFS